MRVVTKSVHRPSDVLMWGWLILLLLITGCERDRITAGREGWLINSSEVADGGPGKDGIPALTHPPMVAASEIDYLSPDDLVVGYRSGTDIRAYPHRVLDWHEIANVTIGEQPLAVTYCPLTGSALAWNRVINGETTTFGVSGLLYRNNLIPYDRATDSYWSQMRMDAVHGDLIETRADVMQVVETTWQTWQSMFPDSRVMSNATGVYPTVRYQHFPYGGYKTSSETLQPIAADLIDSRLHAKERVAGVIANGSARVYRFASFSDSVRTLHDVYGGDSLVVVGSETDNFMMVFNRRLQDGTRLDFSAVQGRFPVVMVDQEGNDWDLLGRAVGGPRTGEKLSHPPTFLAYWFAWYLFYPNPEIFEFTSD